MAKLYNVSDKAEHYLKWIDSVALLCQGLEGADFRSFTSFQFEGVSGFLKYINVLTRHGAMPYISREGECIRFLCATL